SLAVDQARAVVACRRFERMAEGVAQVEERALARFVFVTLDDFRLGAAGGGDRLHACGSAGKDLTPTRLQPGEEVRPIDEAVFGDRRIAGAELARGQRVERLCIGKDQL